MSKEAENRPTQPHNDINNLTPTETTQKGARGNRQTSKTPNQADGAPRNASASRGRPRYRQNQRTNKRRPRDGGSETHDLDKDANKSRLSYSAEPFHTRKKSVDDFRYAIHNQKAKESVSCTQNHLSKKHTKYDKFKGSEKKHEINVSFLKSLLKKPPNTIVFHLITAQTSLVVALNTAIDEMSDGLFEHILLVLGKVCGADCLPSFRMRFLQELASSRIFMLNTVNYLVKSVMTEHPLSNNQCLIAICRILERFLTHIPAYSTSFVTTILGQMKSLKNSKIQQEVQDCLAGIQLMHKNVISRFNEKKIVRCEPEDYGEDDVEPPGNFRMMSIIPTVDDLNLTKPFLRKNKKTGMYQSVDHYLDVQFRLLREDYMVPLRDGIKQIKHLKNKKIDDRRMDVHVYTHVVNTGTYYTENGVVNRLKLDMATLPHVNWDISKRLIYGSLVCISHDNFTTVTIGTVMERDPKRLSKGFIDIFIESNISLDPSTFIVYQMVESSAYFEAYRYNLEGLQMFQETTLPFKEYLLGHFLGEVKPPRYLQCCCQPQYDFQVLLKDVKPRIVNVLKDKEWPNAYELGLDDSQFLALKTAVTKEISVLQGPPGTGKTFIGLKIAKLLLHNRKLWNRKPSEKNSNDNNSGNSILLVCYTNHALDQFLEGILAFTDNSDGSIIRVGGGSSSQNEELMSCLLSKVKKSEAGKKSIPKEIRSSKGAFLKKLQALEKNLIQISKPLKRLDIISEKYLMSMMHQNHKLTFEANKNNCQNQMLQWLVTPHETCHNEGTDEHTVHDKSPNKQLDFSAQETICDPSNLVNGGNSGNCLQESDSESRRTVRYKSESKRSANSTKRNQRHDLKLLSGPSEIEDDLYEADGYRKLDDYDDDMIKIGEESKKALDEEDDDSPEGGAWTVVVNKNMRRMINKELMQHNIISDIMSDEEEAAILDIWKLQTTQRWRLYRLWVSKYCTDVKHRRQALIEEYNCLTNALCEIRREESLCILRKAKVIAMTTTGAAKYRHILNQVRPRIVIVEEAAEVLEAHIVTSLSPSCEHLILIGDHQQLRPNPNVYMLAKKYNLDISLFERLLSNNMLCKTLAVQHRMRPEIASLIVPHIYNDLHNHESVTTLDDVPGVCGNMMFMSHSNKESQPPDSRSKSNLHEVNFLAAFCKYLVQQEIPQEDITILTTYRGQMYEMRRKIQSEPWTKDVKVTPVDNYQGEENQIILLSLVRSNEEGRLGFVKIPNRICVALSRAKRGFYVVGNMKLIREASDIWNSILKSLSENQLVDAFPLACQQHPETMLSVSGSADFASAPEGGCSQPCSARLKCGHVCRLKCHSYDRLHQKYECKRPCIKTCKDSSYKHLCSKMCFEECGDCLVEVPKQITKCGHLQQVPCYLPEDQYSCRKPCNYTLMCGHRCPYLCGAKCLPENKCTIIEVRKWPCGHENEVECFKKPDTFPCPFPVQHSLPCGHEVMLPCSHDVLMYKCMESVLIQSPCPRKCEYYQPCHYVNTKVKCDQIVEKSCNKNPEHKFKVKCCDFDTATCTMICKEKLQCGHECSARCGTCTQEGVHGRCDQYCSRNLHCSHTCQGKCGRPCNPCSHPCSNMCLHARCSKLCGEPCTPCKEKCSWSCQHQQCHKHCEEICYRKPCEVPCNQLLKPCGHKCPGLCGDPCINVCPICSPGFYNQMLTSLGIPYSAKASYVLLQPCNHVIPVSFMDKVVTNLEQSMCTAPTTLTTLSCPMCKVIVHLCPRYQRVIKLCHRDVQKVNVNVQICHDMSTRLFNEAGAKVAHQIEVIMSKPDRLNEHFRKYVGCFIMAHDIRSKIGNIEHTKRGADAPTEEFDTFKSQLFKIVSFDTADINNLVEQAKSLFIRSHVIYMLTYVKDRVQTQILEEVLRQLEKSNIFNTISSYKLQDAVKKIHSAIPIKVRDGIEDFNVLMQNIMHDNLVDFKHQRIWMICSQDHAYPVSPKSTGQPCPICKLNSTAYEQQQSPHRHSARNSHNEHGTHKRDDKGRGYPKHSRDEKSTPNRNGRGLPVHRGGHGGGVRPKTQRKAPHTSQHMQFTSPYPSRGWTSQQMDHNRDYGMSHQMPYNDTGYTGQQMDHNRDYDMSHQMPYNGTAYKGQQMDHNRDYGMSHQMPYNDTGYTGQQMDHNRDYGMSHQMPYNDTGYTGQQMDHNRDYDMSHQMSYNGTAYKGQQMDHNRDYGMSHQMPYNDTAYRGQQMDYDYGMDHRLPYNDTVYTTRNVNPSLTPLPYHINNHHRENTESAHAPGFHRHGRRWKANDNGEIRPQSQYQEMSNTNARFENKREMKRSRHQKRGKTASQSPSANKDKGEKPSTNATEQGKMNDRHRERDSLHSPGKGSKRGGWKKTHPNKIENAGSKNPVATDQDLEDLDGRLTQTNVDGSQRNCSNERAKRRYRYRGNKKKKTDGHT